MPVLRVLSRARRSRVVLVDEAVRARPRPSGRRTACAAAGILREAPSVDLDRCGAHTLTVGHPLQRGWLF
jgi:hypothetical protein